MPTLTVITTEFFDLFMEENNLRETAFSGLRDDLIAGAFQKADLPAPLVGDLRALIAQVHSPLAIRSSSLLEDAMFEPFASVYATKMIPNNQLDTDARFRKLCEAVKFIYASTFFREAKNYIQATRHTAADEKMAVIIQEVVGARHGLRFLSSPLGRGPVLQLLSAGQRQAGGRSHRPRPRPGENDRRRRRRLVVFARLSAGQPSLQYPGRLPRPDPVGILGGQHGLAGRVQPHQRDRVPDEVRPGRGRDRRRAPVHRLDLQSPGRQDRLRDLREGAPGHRFRVPS